LNQGSNIFYPGNPFIPSIRGSDFFSLALNFVFCLSLSFGSCKSFNQLNQGSNIFYLESFNPINTCSDVLITFVFIIVYHSNQNNQWLKLSLPSVPQCFNASAPASERL
jgi:hypothetical protein